MSPWRFVRVYLLPPEHGGWFMLLGPLLLGILAAGRPSGDLLLLLALALAGYVWRQPLIVLAKVAAGRRAHAQLGPALGAGVGTGVVVAVLFGGLLRRGHPELVWLAAVAAPVLAWQLGLVARRRERQLMVEVAGAGVLGLAAPAAYWVSLGGLAPAGWWLWLASWLYAAPAIVAVSLRLGERRLAAAPPPGERWRRGRPALVGSGLALAATTALAAFRVLPPLAPVPYALALGHALRGVWHPAVGARPARIGFEQASATLAFYLLLGLAFRVAG